MYSLFAILTLLIGAATIAQGTDFNLIEKVSGVTPGGSAYGARIYFFTPQRTSAPGWAEGDKMSGTRIEVEVSAFCGTPNDNPGSQVGQFRVYFENAGATAIYENLQWSGYNKTFKFRFATTIVDDGNDIRIRVQAAARDFNSPQSYMLSETFTFQAYNKLQLLGTKVNSTGTQVPAFSTASTGVVEQADSKHAVSHTSLPTLTSSALSQTESSILSNAALATFACYITHGTSTQIGDSTHVPGPNTASEHVIDFFLELGPFAAAWKSILGVPAFNLVAMYACSVLDGYAAQLAFGVDGPNRCIAGFDQPVSLFLWSKSSWENTKPGNIPSPIEIKYIYEHARVLFQSLLTMHTSKAIDAANDAYPPLDASLDELILGTGEPAVYDNPMMLQGDGSTTIRFVFLTLSERFTRESSGLPLTVFWVAIP